MIPGFPDIRGLTQQMQNMHHDMMNFGNLMNATNQELKQSNQTTQQLHQSLREANQQSKQLIDEIRQMNQQSGNLLQALKELTQALKSK